ncbi:MAG: ABC transporter ATP-binding protein [Chitinophagaceae bacterium]
MAEKMIEVEGLSKKYRLGSFGSGTLTQDIASWWKSTAGKENLEKQKTQLNGHSQKNSGEYVWSLKDINFSVNRGDVFGIIGKNGAGKSTLLKILSKITKPSTGIIRIKGRIASLLEVGTGFHPDLSGRENIFLNGAILGMSKQEIKNKFDEIVAFSEIEKFIDTPVKRYSSGMYVRLGFAIAAHLEPEILIVDEVLAVGDYEFQQKCLGKMKDVSINGRTILFVSHSMPAVKSLCNKAILLEHGTQKFIGNVTDALNIYQMHEMDSSAGKRGEFPLHLPAYYTEWRLEGDHVSSPHSCYSRDLCSFTFEFTVKEPLKNCEARLMIKYEHLIILHASSLDNTASFSVVPGHYQIQFTTEFPVRDAQFEVEVVFLSMGKILDTWLSSTKLTVMDNFESHVNAGVVKTEAIFSMTQQVSLFQV